MTNKVTLILRSREGAQVASSNNNVIYTTNLSSFLDPNVIKYKCEMTFISEFYLGLLPDMGVVNMNFATTNVFNGNAKLNTIGYIKVGYYLGFNAASEYSYYQATTQDNNPIIINYPYNTNSIQVNLTNIAGGNLPIGSSMPHYALSLTLTALD